ncbi:MAG: hypothetical protein GEV07_03675 [Streptosporangiales bacterium]|nr:hypothetical protein [Streptosporangiales bacterium]
MTEQASPSHPLSATTSDEVSFQPPSCDGLLWYHSHGEAVIAARSHGDRRTLYRVWYCQEGSHWHAAPRTVETNQVIDGHLPPA